MKKIAAFTVVLMILGFSSISFAEIKVGVVDINRVLANSLQMQNAQTDLQNKFTPRTQEIISLQNTFLNDIEKYQQDNKWMSINLLKKQQQKLIDENKKLQETQLNFQRDIFTTRDQALRPILKQIEDIVNKIAQEQKFDLIVSRLGTAYNNSYDEITVQVIAEMGKLAK